MKSRSDILKAHYTALAKKAATWFGLAALMSTTLVALPTQAAAQITPRKTTVLSSKAAANTTYTFSFTGATATAIKAIKFELCSSPLQGTACAVVSSSTMAGATFVAGSSTGGLSTWTISPSATATTAILQGASSIAGNTAFVVQFTGIVNPNAANTTYYTRVTTYTDQSASLPAATGQDYGAMALSTGTELTVAANVQESLNFTVGTSGTCGSITGSSPIPIGTGADNVLSTSAASSGTSVMCINTNASSGYALNYISNQASSNGFTNGSYTIADSSGGNTFSSATSGNVDFFGMNLRSNTGGSGGPTAGADPTVAPTSYGSGYGTANTFAFARGVSTNIANYTTGPIGDTLYTVTYAAQAGIATATGAYQVKINYVATGTF